MLFWRILGLFVNLTASTGASQSHRLQVPKPKEAAVSVPAIRRKPRREEIPPGEVLCSYCTAKCCRYFALPIEQPTKKGDWEFVRWYLMHEGATLFREDDTWYLLVHSQCKHLQPDNRCGIYESRPTVCREYTTDECEYEDDWLYEQYLETSEQVAEYAEVVLPRKKGQSIRSPRPPLLRVLAR
jgi:Fe-S-cluster containining protein